jgi:hypothetical protein
MKQKVNKTQGGFKTPGVLAGMAALIFVLASGGCAILSGMVSGGTAAGGAAVKAAEEAAEEPAAAAGPGIYISGYDNSTPVYWKDGERIELPKNFFGDASDIVVVKGSVYIAGSPDGNSAYWKNGKLNALPDGKYATAIAVDGNDVYVAGGYYEGTSPHGVLYPVYWKNGTRFVLPTVYAGNERPESGVKEGGNAEAIAIAGKDVYIAGWDGHRAVYWKNGERFELPAGADGNASALGIAIVGDDVYIAGWDSPAGSNAHAVYWKNGERTVVATAREAAADAIAVVGSDVYVAGTDGQRPTPAYWKNGKRFALPITGDRGKVNGIAVDGEDVYVVGCLGYGDVPIVWKNGERIELPKAPAEKRTSADATGIVIVK